MYFNYLDEEIRPVQQTEPVQQPEPVEHAEQVQQAEPVQQTGPVPQPDRMLLLKSRIEQMLRNSQDPAFTHYLKKMHDSVSGEESRIAHMSMELEKQFHVYQQNMSNAVKRQNHVQQPAPQQFYRQPMPQPMLQPMPAMAAQKGNGAEYAVGAAVLGVVGSVFILTSMILLGMNFMEGMMKGMLFYAACVCILVFAELALYRRWPKLGMTVSAIGMAGLYISTLVNYLTLQNFNEWVALGITAAITLFVILFSRKRDAVAYRILGMTAMYCCMLLIFRRMENEGGFAQTQLVTLTLMGLLMNVMCLAVPVKRAYTGVNITHLSINTFFTLIVYCGWLRYDVAEAQTFGESWQYPFFVAVSILIMQLIFVAQIRWKEKQLPGDSMGKNMGICIAYAVCTLVYAALVLSLAGGQYEIVGDVGTYLPYRLICSGGMLLLCLIPLLGLRAKQEKWFAWYFLCISLFAIHVVQSWDLMEACVCLFLLYMMSKVLSFTKKFMLKLGDACVTAVVCGFMLGTHEESEVWLLFVGVLLSILCINCWKTYFEILITYSIALFTAFHMLPLLKLPVFVGVMFVGILVFNNVKRWNGDKIEIFNATALVGSAVSYLFLINPVYQNTYLTYLCMIIFGIAMIVICIQKQYKLDLSAKHWILAGFLTYMGLVVRTNYSIVNSILLMLVALFCVGMGFQIKKKSIRIYGLILALIICAKLVLYDFGGANTLQKTIVFFIVGVITLIIAAIYMILEKKQEKICDEKEML